MTLPSSSEAKLITFARPLTASANPPVVIACQSPPLSSFEPATLGEIVRLMNNTSKVMSVGSSPPAWLLKRLSGHIALVICHIMKPVPEIWHISAIAQEKQIWTRTTPALTDPCPTCPTYRNSSSVLLPRYSLPILTLTICCLSISLHTCHPTSQKQPFRQSTTTLSAQQTMASIACHSVGLQRGFWHCRPPSPSIRSCFCELHSHKLVWVILDQPDPTLYTSWQADISFPSWLQRSAGY